MYDLNGTKYETDGIFQRLEQWLKRIFSLQVLSLLLALVTGWITYRQFIRDNGGVTTVTYDGTVLSSNGRRQIVVCMDAPGRIPDISLSPTFANESEYSVRDFALQYTYTCRGIRLKPSDFYQTTRTPDKTILRYKEKTLYTYSEAEAPLYGLTAEKDAGQCTAHVRVTYNGARQPFEYD